MPLCFNEENPCRNLVMARLLKCLNMKFQQSLVCVCVCVVIMNEPGITSLFCMRSGHRKCDPGTLSVAVRSVCPPVGLAERWPNTQLEYNFFYLCFLQRLTHLKLICLQPGDRDFQIGGKVFTSINVSRDLQISITTVDSSWRFLLGVC